MNNNNYWRRNWWCSKKTDERDKEVIFKNCAPFINCKTEIINTEIDNAKNIDIVMPMYNLIEYRDNYSKPYVSLWQYYKDDLSNNLTDSESFRSKLKITGKVSDDRIQKMLK